MFAAPNFVQKTQWTVVTLATLGNDKNTKKGAVNFVPLFGFDPENNGVTPKMIKDDGITSMPVNIDELRDNNTFELFEYRAMFPNPTDANKRTQKGVRWVNSGLRTGNEGATLSDPGYTLGLDLKERSNMPGLGGAKGLDFPHSTNLVAEIRVPVLWAVDLNAKGHVVDGSGTPAMLVLKANQFANLVEAMEKFGQDETDWKEGSKKVSQPWLGTNVMELDKDSSRGFDTYQWSLAGTAAALNSHIAAFFEEAAEKVAESREWTLENQRGYGHIIEDFTAGKITGEEAEQSVVAEIAVQLLNLWGESHDGSVENILSVFDSVQSQYSLVPSAGLAAAIDAAKAEVPADAPDVDEDKPF